MLASKAEIVGGGDPDRTGDPRLMRTIEEKTLSNCMPHRTPAGALLSRGLSLAVVRCVLLCFPLTVTLFGLEP